MSASCLFFCILCVLHDAETSPRRADDIFSQASRVMGAVVSNFVGLFDASVFFPFSAHLSHLSSQNENRDNVRKSDVRIANIEAAKAVADAVRTSLGPRGMDKMVSGRDL